MRARVIPPAVFGFFLVLLLLRYWIFLFGGHAFASPLHSLGLEPIVYYVKESVSHGTFPGWNPYCYVGMPQLPGLFPGVYYPINVLFLMPGTETGCAAFLIVHLLIGAFGVYVLCRFIRNDVVPPLVLAFVYLLLQIVLVTDVNMSLAAGLAWLPFCIFAALRARRETSHKAGVIVTVSLFLGLVFLSGSMIVSLLSVASVLAIACAAIPKSHAQSAPGTAGVPPACELASHRNRSLTKLLALFSVSIALACSLAAPVLLPTLEWFSEEPVGKRFWGALSSNPSPSLGSLWSVPSIAVDEAQEKNLTARNIFPKQRSTVGFRGHPTVSFRLLTENGGIARDGALGFFKALPLAYAIDNWKWVLKENEVYDLVFAKEFDPQKTVLIERNKMLQVDEDRLDKLPLSRVNPPSGPPLTDSAVRDATTMVAVDIMKLEPEHVSISVNLEKPSFVIFNDAFYPGWKAYIDGVPTPLYRANGIAKAAFVTPGPHLVAFDFRSDSLKVGFTLALFSLCIEVLLTFWWLWQLLAKTVRFLSFGKFE